MTAAIAIRSITGGKIASRTITSTNLANDSVTHSKIDALAVDTAELDNLAVTEGKIESNAVTTFKIKDDAVTLAKIAATSANNGKYLTVSGGNPFWGNAPTSSLPSNPSFTGISVSGTTATHTLNVTGTFYHTGSTFGTFSNSASRQSIVRLHATGPYNLDGLASKIAEIYNALNRYGLLQLV